MEQLINDKHKIDPVQNPKRNRKVYKKCNECNRRRRTLDGSHQICHICYKIKTILKPKQSGNKIIDDFIKYTQINLVKNGGRMEFVPYDQFKNIEFIAEGGFSKIYKATWVDGPISWSYFKWENNIIRSNNYTVVLKKLNSSNNITSKELNELKVFYQIFSNSYSSYISEYFGITQDPVTKDIMIVMPHYNSGDLIHYISNNFYKISWETKLYNLENIIFGLKNIHEAKIIHRDLHSGNIFFEKKFLDDEHFTYIGDLGISKSATESTDNKENYGIIPYMAPEIFQGQKYTKASDIYSFGMIMWEFMTSRRPFWDRNHDINLIIDICDGLRPPIVTNAPEGYIELMKECWHSDPGKRPTAGNLYSKIEKIYVNETSLTRSKNPTKIIESSDIGPVIKNNPGAIYQSRPLSRMIQSAMSLRSSRSQTTNFETDPFYFYQKNNTIFTDKRKFDDDSAKDTSNENEQNVKRRKPENEHYDYFTKEIELDINTKFNQPQNNEYITKEFDIDINELI